VIKINKRGRSQRRIILITSEAVYNLKPRTYNCRRRIALESIDAIVASEASDEFVIKVPSEYDYRYRSERRDDVIECLNDLIEQKGRRLKTELVEEKELFSFTITKDAARLRLEEREEELIEKRNKALERHESDEEEEKEGGETEQLIGSDDRISVDSFHLLKVLGRGTFGKVMQVQKKDTGKIYAMKILKKTMILARDQVDHTKAERQILKTLNHPFLMGLRYAFQTETKLYLVMDFFKGGELFFHLKNRRKFTEEEARFFVAEISLALGHLHTMDFIYRDLKPENILMDDLGHLCLTDFGLSKDLDPDNPESTTFCGTPEYLAPEILQGSPHGKPVDWWSLGILLYELTVGIPPFYSHNTNEMYHKIQYGVLKFPPHLSEECRHLISSLLNRNPDDRLGSSTDDVEEIKAHPFFESTDWEAILSKEATPPYRPRVNTAEGDTSLFSAEFTDEPVVDSLVPESHITDAMTSEFVGFTFNPDAENSVLDV
jgi:serine/threonine protein kinase